MSTVRVIVTQEDIDLGKPYDSWHCPIARALWRAIGRKCAVGTDDFRLPGTCGPVPLPNSAHEFINRFDDHEHVEPFEFEIPVSDAMWRITR